MTMMDPTAVQTIWTSVLAQVVRDLTRTTQHQSGESARAERWIGSYPSRDFCDVCALAGLEPTASHAWFRRLCDTPFDERRAMVPAFEAPQKTPRKTSQKTTVKARSGAGVRAVTTRKRRAAA